jgi:hypothetical protein
VFLLCWAEKSRYDYQTFWFYQTKSGVSVRQLTMSYKLANVKTDNMLLPHLIFFYCICMSFKHNVPQDILKTCSMIYTRFFICVQIERILTEFLLMTRHTVKIGRTVSADIFCAEITAGKSQRLKEITTAVGKSKHEF